MGIPELISLIGLGITIVVVGLVILGCLRLSRKFHKSRPKPATGPKPATPPWIWVFLIALVGLIAYVVSVTNPEPRLKPEPAAFPGWARVLWVFGLPVVVLVGWIVISYLRVYDREVRKAFKLAQAGDKDGALVVLKAAMERDQASEGRWNSLGALYCFREEWDDAYQAFLKAEEIGGRKAEYVGNQGLALWKLGRLAKAEEFLRDACGMQPTSAIFPCNYGFVLVDLGRIDEAGHQLAVADQNYKKWVTIPPSAKKPLGVEIERLREKLKSSPAT
jgi:hypothetical protein